MKSLFESGIPLKKKKNNPETRVDEQIVYLRAGPWEQDERPWRVKGARKESQ